MRTAFFVCFERIEHKPGTSEHQGDRLETTTRNERARAQPGAHQPRPGTERAPGRAPGDIEPGTNEPGAHSSRTTRRTDARGTPGDHDQGQNKHQGAQLNTPPGGQMPGAHLETSAISQGRANTRRAPGSISHKPGTSEPGRNLERIEHKPGTNEPGRPPGAHQP